MHVNVHIVGRKDGKVIAEHHGHNVWVDTGRTHLAQLTSLDPPSADAVITNERIRYMGLGIGSVHQPINGLADQEPWLSDFPIGTDPNTTNGHEYRAALPLFPPISTLERPIPIRDNGGDEWLQDPYLGSLYEDPYTIVHRFIIDTNDDEVLFSGYTSMPLTEIGLFHAGADVTDRYNVLTPTPPDTRIGAMVAYHSFATLLITAGSVFEFTWKVKF